MQPTICFGPASIVHHSKRCALMSHKIAPFRAVSAITQKASAIAHGRRSLGAISDRSAGQRRCRYSITSSAIASTLAGISKPSAFAVLRLMTRLNLVGCITGKSAGRSPLRMRPVYTPA